MRISKLIAGVASVMLVASSAGAGTPPFVSTQEALKQGISAYQGGYYEIAIPALEQAAASNEFMAQYFLARIYADSAAGGYTDHVKAYMLLQKIVDEYAEVDPDEDKRAPFVGKSLTALAGYVRRGLPEIGLNADLKRSIEYLHNASVIFNDEDAQFELAKLQLKGEGVAENIPAARHWLATLTQRGHAGAQAFLADLLWRGKFMEADQPRALALISIAVQNAPPHERLWIEDIYQNIYCGSGDGLRKKAGGIVAGWGNRYGRKPEERDRSDLGLLSVDPERTCKNGEPVGPLNVNGDTLANPAQDATAESQPRPPAASPFAYGSAGASGLREIGTPSSSPQER